MSSLNQRKLIVNKDYNPLILGEILRKHWFAPILFIVFFSTVAFFYLRYTKPIFQSKAVIQIVEEDRVKEVLGKDAFTDRESADGGLSKYIELLKSEFIFEKAVERLSLYTSVYSEGKLLTKDLYRSNLVSVEPVKLLDSTLCGVHFDIKEKKGKLEISYTHTVSYTHLTLPTIYSV